MKIGCAQVSTEEQNLDLQIKALTDIGCGSIVTDKGQSGEGAAENGKVAIEAKRETVSVMADFLGVNRSIIYCAIGSSS